MTTIAERLKKLGITLPEAAAPAANYTPFVLHAGVLTVSGQLPMENGAVTHTGLLGDGVDVPDGQTAARLCAINILAQIQAALGSLEQVERVIRLGGFVAATPTFTDHPMVVNGASDLIAEVFGDAGVHARVAVGVASLPFGACVEVDAMVAVRAPDA
ncbi:MAG: RidA family protein [Pseudomonadota bacterium]